MSVLRVRRSGACAKEAGLALAAALWLIFSPYSAAQPTHVFGISYRAEYMQVGDFVFTSMPMQQIWEAWARGFSAPEDELTRAELTDSRENVHDLALDANGAYSGGLATEFPPGPCTFTGAIGEGPDFTVVFQVPAAAYPAPPKFANLLSVQPEAGEALNLEIQPGAGAGANDFLALTVSAFNLTTFGNWRFETPWPGEPGALSGLATSVTIPGELLKPGDMLQVRLFCYRPVFRDSPPAGVAFAGSASGVFTTLNVPAQPEDSDLLSYRLLPGRVYLQDEVSPPVPPAQGGFAFEASAWARESGRITNAAVTLPGGAQLDLGAADDESALLESSLVFERESELWAAAMPGEYAWSFDGVAKGHQTAAAVLAAGPFPSPIRIGNWSDLQSTSFTNSVTIYWTLPPGAKASDQIEFVAADAGGKLVYRYPNITEGDPVLSGTETHFSIPKGKLSDGVDYEGRLRYVQILSEDAESIEDAVGRVGRFAETRFLIGSLLAAPLEILTTNLPEGEVAIEYHAQLLANGGRTPFQWSLGGGSLPLGLSLSAEGRISGFPAANGTWNLAVLAVDAVGQIATQMLEIVVTGMVEPLAIITGSIPEVHPGLYYLAELAFTGGVPPYDWSIASGRLPLGFELQGCCGLIAGEPLESGEFDFEVRLRDGAGQVDQRAFRLAVAPAAVPSPLRITRSERRELGNLTLTLAGVQEERVTIEGSEDLAEWTSILATNLPESQRVEIPGAAASHAFFRARIGPAERVPDPLLVNALLSPGQFAEAEVYTNAASLLLTNEAGIILRLDIPEGALAQKRTVRMSVVQSVAGLPLNALLWAVEFQPEGLYFLRTALLTITFPAGAPPSAVSFAYGSKGRDCHLSPAFQQGGQVLVPIQHFSGTGQGSGTQEQIDQMNNRSPCQPLYAGEQVIAKLLQDNYPDLPPAEELAAAMEDWLEESVMFNLRVAERDASQLDWAVKEFLRWQTIGQLLGIGAPWEEKAMRSLALGYANAIKKAEARCASSEIGQHRVMIQRTREARLLGLEEYLPGEFDEETILERASRCLRFQLVIDSIIEIPGGWAQQVRSDPLYFRWDPKNIGEGGMYLLPEGPANLNLVSWDLLVDQGRTRPSTGGNSFTGIWLKFDQDTTEEPAPDPKDPCKKPPADEFNPKIECFFEVQDPINGMYVKDAEGNWHFVPLPPGAGGRWGTVFKIGHYEDYKTLPDINGNSASGYHVENWEVSEGQVFATKIYIRTVPLSEGKANEVTYFELRHAPLSNAK